MKLSYTNSISNTQDFVGLTVALLVLTGVFPVSSVLSQSPGSRLDFWLLFNGVYPVSSVGIVCPRSKFVRS